MTELGNAGEAEMPCRRRPFRSLLSNAKSTDEEPAAPSFACPDSSPRQKRHLTWPGQRTGWDPLRGRVLGSRRA